MGRDKTLIEILEVHATRSSNPFALIWLDEKLKEQTKYSYSELHLLALKAKKYILEFARKGERVVLMLPSGPELVVAMLGCLFSGVIAVVVHPTKSNKNAKWRKVCNILDDCGPVGIVTLNGYLDSTVLRLSNLPLSLTIKSLSLGNLEHNQQSFEMVKVQLDDLALLQYTSGSTGDPKGVMISHANIIANMKYIQTLGCYTKADVFCSWVPLHHDLGLMANLFQALYLGASLVLMSPMTFARNSANWLKTISRYRATASGAPNFAYEVAANKVTDEEARMLELSSWRVAFVGAEPIRPSTIKRFSSKFRTIGFRESAFFPAYGMAESTLVVTGSEVDTGPIITSFEKDKLRENTAIKTHDRTQDGNTHCLVSSGLVRDNQDICIVDPETCQLEHDRKVGEIWLNSPSLSTGYWGKNKINEEVFGARRADGKGPYYRTGDMGFIFEKQLYVHGRLKDLIIINGVNYIPQDIEESVQDYDTALLRDSGVAFSVESANKERLVIVQEVTRKDVFAPLYSTLISGIQDKIWQDYEILPLEIVLVRALSLPKTSSGKLQRNIIRKCYLAKQLNVKVCKRFLL